MADETTLRLRIETDTTGVSTGVQRARDEFGRFIKVGQDAEEQLRRTGQAAGDTARQFQGLGDATHISFGKLQAGMVAATVAGNALFEALDAVTRGLAAPITELLDAEQAAAMLQGTFGGLTAEMQQVADLASQLGANNAFFDDDALAQAAATLKLFGANAQAIQELLPYVNDLAIAFGVDVNDAAQLVGQALMGQTRGLARMVPEVRGANSQLEVLAALQASAARNTDIARQRTEGLGGQLALLRRQAADAAQGFGTAMLPALNAVLRVMNDNLLPVLGKMMAAFAGLSAFFGNLGKGLNLSDLTRVAGEAILNAEAQFNAVSARVEQRASKIAGQAGNLAMAGTFGGGGAAAAAASRAAAPAARGVIGTEMLGPAVPSQLRYEVFTEDPVVRAAREKQQQEAIEADRRAHREAMQQQEQQRVAMFRYLKQEADAKKKAADDLNAYYLESAIQIGTSISNVFKKAFSGARVTEADVQGLLGDVAVLTAGIVGGAIGGRETGEVAARIARPVTDALLPIVSVLGKGLLGINALQEKANQQALDATNEQIRASQLQVEAALVQAEAAKKQQEAAAGAVISSQERRFAATQGPQALTAFDITQALGNIPGGGYEGIIGKVLRESTTEQLATFGDLASRALKGDVQAQVDLVRQLTAGREMSGQIGSTYETQELLLQLVERLPQVLGGGAGLQPGGIQNGTSPDRPVYVFDVRPREGFGFAPESFFFRNRGAGTSRAVAGNPLPVAQAAPVTPRVAPVMGGARGRAAG